MRAVRAISRFMPVLLGLFCVAAIAPAAMAGQRGAEKIDASVLTVIEATGGQKAIPVIMEAPGAAADVVARLPRGVRVTNLPLIGSVAAFLTPSEIRTMSGTPFVDQIVADNPVYGFGHVSSMDVTNLTIGLADLQPWDEGGPSGRGVTVAILDSGVSVNTDLSASRLIGWKDFVNGRSAAYDDAGHGTFVAGLIAGDGSASVARQDGGSASVQFRGVAPAANVVAIKVLDETGQGRASTLIAGVAWAIEHRDDYDIRVLNISIGGNPVASVKHDPVARAVEAAWREGIAVVCAAGNEGEFGPGGVLSPGNDPFVITVGATDTRQTADVTDDVVAAYSSLGPTLFDRFAKPDLVAPGNRLVSLRAAGSYIDTSFPENTLPVAEYLTDMPAGAVSNYVRLSGTSASAPLVAGAAALMFERDPALTPDDVKVRLMSTADPVRGARQQQQGAGALDVDEALSSQSRATGYALSAFAGKGKSSFKNADYTRWAERSWSKYGWTKFKWTKFKWTKFKWTEVTWTKFKWTRFKWTEYEWARFKWTVLLQGQ